MIEKVLAALVGSVLLGIGINAFLVPHHLLDGGLIGIGLIIHYFYGWPTGLSMVVLSIPLYIFAWFYNKNFFFYSIQGLLISSLFIDIFSSVHFPFKLTIISSAILGGILVGCGIGLMLRYETSTGGTDLLAQVLSKVLTVNVGILIFVIDGFVILSGLKVVGFEKFMYSFITIIFVGIMTSICVVRPQQS